MRSPIVWLGGKGLLCSKLLKFIPDHNTYVEPFGGGMSLLLAKDPSKVEVYNDIDSSLVNFFSVLRNEEKFNKFYRMVCLTPYSREEYKNSILNISETESDIEKAYNFFVISRMSFGGRFGAGWGSVIKESSRGMANTTSQWLTAVEKLPEVAERLLRVQIDHVDFRNIFSRYNSEDIFLYVDPPYVSSSRSNVGYSYEMSDLDHENLLEICLSSRSKILISGYDTEMYNILDKNGWGREEFDTSCFVAGRVRNSNIKKVGSAPKRREIVWYNY